jgi:PAS domain S-box-containing protein
MATDEAENRQMRTVSLQNANTIFLARQNAERDLLAAKEALAKREEQLRAITDATPALIAYLDTDCRYRFANLQYALWFGHPQDQIIGLHMREVLGEKAFAGLLPHVASALAGEDVEFECEVPYHDASTRFVKATYHPDRADDGSLRGIYVLVIDISDRKRAEDALRQTENRLFMAMDAGQMGAWEWVVATGKVSWSPTLEALHGLAPGSFGGSFDDVQREMHPDDRARVLATISECLEKRTEYRIEYRIVRPDGVALWIEGRGKLLLDEQGNPERMTGLCMDISARKHAEDALRQSEQFNRTIIESSRDCIMTLTLDGVMLWINRVGLDMVSATEPAQIVGKSWFDFWEGENRKLAEDAARSAVGGGTGTFVGYFTIAGSTTWCDVAVTPIVDADSKPERLLVVSRDATERRKLEETHARLAAVVEFSEDAIVSKTLESIVVTWNNGAERMFGYTAAEMIGRSITILIPPDCVDEEPEILARVRRGEVVAPYESVRIRKDGTLLNVSLTVSPIKDAGGKIIGASKIARDITQRKQADTERARLASVLEKSLNEIFIFDTDLLRFLYVNEGALRNLGYSMEAMRQMTPLDLKPEFTEEKFRAMVAPLLRGEKEKLIFYTAHRRAAGSLYPVEVHLQAVAHAGERVFMAVILDITERRKGEEERERLLASEQLARAQAEEAESRARFLAEASASLASTLDYEVTLGNVAQAAVPGIADWCAVHMREPDGGIRVVATAHFDPAKVVVAKELQERYPDDPDSPFGMPFVLRSGQSLLYAEISDDLLVATCRDAEHLTMIRDLGLKSAVIVPLIANGQTLGAITLVAAESGRHFSEADLPFAEDLAARAAAAAENARLYREVRHANTAKDHFMAVLSHELRTPLNPVLMTVADLERDDTMPAHVREQMTVLRRNVELEARLIDDLLDSTRIANGKLQLQRTVVDARELLRRAIAIVEGDARTKGVRLSVTMCAAAAPIDGDSARLQQVFWNVVKNAVKFTPAGGSIHVECEPTDCGTIRVAVTDTGIGIAPEDAAKIFNAFEQGDTGITHRFGGLGLGLAISKALVAMHQGTLTAHSEGRGCGATFTVELPLTSAARTHIVEDPASTTEHRALRLLIVEDHEATSAIMARLLKKRGYIVTVVTSVQTALEALDHTPLDLVISDLGLPDGTGHELMAKISEKQNLPGIALSGYGTDADITRSREAGFSAHLTKPIDIELLDGEIQLLGSGIVLEESQMSPTPSTDAKERG